MKKGDKNNVLPVATYQAVYPIGPSKCSDNGRTFDKKKHQGGNTI